MRVSGTVRTSTRSSGAPYQLAEVKVVEDQRIQTTDPVNARMRDHDDDCPAPVQ